MRIFIHMKSSCQLESMATSSTSFENVIYGQKRRPEKSSMSAVDDNRASQDEYDFDYSGDQAEDGKKDVDHVEEIKSPTDSTGVADLAGKKGKA